MCGRNLVSCRRLLAAALSVLMLAQSGNVFAAPRGHGEGGRGENRERDRGRQMSRDRDWARNREISRERERPHHHYRTIAFLPRGYLRIELGGLTFYYENGVFYRRSLFGFVVVSPPRGAVVVALPVGYQTVFIDGNRYYYYNGVYYQSAPSGYIIVPTPVAATPAAAMVAPPATTAAPGKENGGTAVVNIPNSDGTYTPVILQKSGKGYIGPQGEYYADNPTVEQLKVLYGK